MKIIAFKTGQISQNESLFFYEAGQNVSTFSDPDHVPQFLDEIDNGTLAEATQICGGTENIECLFDFSQTRNEELAVTTASTNNENNNDQQIIGKYTIYTVFVDIKDNNH